MGLLFQKKEKEEKEKKGLILVTPRNPPN